MAHKRKQLRSFNHLAHKKSYKPKERIYLHTAFVSILGASFRLQLDTKIGKITGTSLITQWGKFCFYKVEITLTSLAIHTHEYVTFRAGLRRVEKTTRE